MKPLTARPLPLSQLLLKRIAIKRLSASRLLLAYGIILSSACFSLHGWVAVKRDVQVPRAIILSAWKRGKRVARVVDTPQNAANRQLLLRAKDTTVVAEELLDEGPILGTSKVLFGASIVPGRDGIQVILGGRVAYLTPDDLVQLRGYDCDIDLFGASIVLGVDRDVVLGAAASELGVTPKTLLAEAKFRRIAMRHATVPAVKKADLNTSTLKQAVLAAGLYVAHQVRADGSFRYEIDPISGAVSPGYSWPRHAGATWFLARAAAYSQSAFMASKAALATHKLTTDASLRCGAHRCIGEGTRVDIGSSALALLALCEMHTSHLASDLEPIIRELAEFLRSQQRPDGEFDHTYDIAKASPIDEQLPFYTGETALAMSQAGSRHLKAHRPANPRNGLTH